ncbi:MAG TPA: isoprenylcysteine carboxylmethyltransferase family protein [Candidatus Binatia bacterium]|nr:isoprenylcysteine carboxylmethyltransferase family protein [Candidatus Binatia bacterium]
MRTVGLLLALAGAALAVRSVTLLAGRGRPRRGPAPEFVIAGPYLWMRNPLLAGLVTALAGVALWRDSRALLVLAGVAAWAAHWWVTRVEEPDLRRRFGAAYEAYLRSVPRWMPHRPRAPT